MFVSPQIRVFKSNPQCSGAGRGPFGGDEVMGADSS